LRTALDIERRPIGSSRLALARVALGCGNFGGVGSAPEFFGQGIAPDDALAVMDAAWELGIRHFDTADAYGGGRSERTIGSWIASRGVVPTLTTKVFNPMTAGGDHGLAPERIARRLDASLERLGVGRVDLYLAHDFDPEVPLADSLGAFEAAREAGRVREYGVSNFTAGQLEVALTIGSPVAIQNAHSLLERGDEAEVLPLCAESGVAFIAFSPLSGGWLTGKYGRAQPFPPGSRMTQRPEPYRSLLNDTTFDALERLGVLAAGREMSLAGLSLAWLLADSRVGQIVVGPNRPEHLGPVREALERPLSAEERDRVSRAVSGEAALASWDEGGRWR
jgi:aryl-alcohol dehydrogenase-like predicted oxidoreductase